MRHSARERCRIFYAEWRRASYENSCTVAGGETIFSIRANLDSVQKAPAALVRLLEGDNRETASEVDFVACSAPQRRRATLAQPVEQLIRNQQVVGSNPTGGSKSE